MAGIIVKIERIDTFGRKVTQEINRDWWIHVIRTVDGSVTQPAAGMEIGFKLFVITEDRKIGSEEKSTGSTRSYTVSPAHFNGYAGP